MTTPADTRHRLAQQRLQAKLGARLDALLRALGDPMTQDAFNIYNVAATRLVAGSQHRSAQLAIAYLTPSFPPKRLTSPDKAIASVLVTSTSPVTRSPMLRVWGMVAEGAKMIDALDSAGAYAATLASNDLAVAERGGLDEAVSASGQRVIGWRKEPSGNACDWCQEVAGGLYSSADAVPFHANDACSVAPVTEGEE